MLENGIVSSVKEIIEKEIIIERMKHLPRKEIKR